MILLAIKTRNVTGGRNVSHCQQHDHMDNHIQPTNEMTPRFKLFTVLRKTSSQRINLSCKKVYSPKTEKQIISPCFHRKH